MAGPARYSFIFSKVKAKESRLLSCEQLKSLLKAENISELALQLAGTYYEEMFASEMEPEERERIIWEKDITLHKELIKHLKGREKKIVEMFLERYDLDKLKTILRVWFNKDKAGGVSWVSSDICFHFDTEKLPRAANINDFILLLKDTPYMKALAEAKSDFQQFNNLFYLEWALEKDYLKRTVFLIKTLPLSERAALMKIWGLEIDIANVSFILRTRKYYRGSKEFLQHHLISETGRIKEEDMQEAFLKDSSDLLEYFLSKLQIRFREPPLLASSAGGEIEYLLFYILMQRARAALGGYPFSIAVVVAFLVLKYLETKNVISIFYSCLYGLDRTQKERLVIC